MKRRYIFRVLDLFNRSIKLLKGNAAVLALLCIVNVLLHYLLQYMGKFSGLVNTGADMVTIIMKWLIMTLFLIIGGMIMLLLPEIITRLRFDSLTNMVQSIRLTFKAREFLSKHGDEEVVERFNTAIGSTRVDIDRRYFTLVIDLPNDHQLQAMIVEASKGLAVQMGSLLDEDYIFTNIRQVRTFLVLEGTKI